MDTRVYYDIALGDFEMFQRILYGCAWALLFMLLGNAVFYRKNLWVDLSDFWSSPSVSCSGVS
jgi:hypothetical protein